VVARSDVDAEHAVLGHARARAFIPGTNLRGQSGGAAWLFLLPSLELGLVVCLGAPSAAALRTLAGIADEVVVCGGRRDRWAARRRCGRAGIAGVQVVAPTGLPERRPDLVVVTGDGSDPVLPAAVGRARAAFVERPERAPVAASGSCELRIGPAAGEPCLAAAENDTATLTYLERSTACSGTGRHAVLTAQGLTGGRLEPPAYIRDIATTSGRDLSGYRLGLAAPTGYASRKTVMFLFRDEDREPELVVKLARDPRQNERLENEWRALRWLSDADVRGELPRPAFFGHHAGLAILGESAVHGTPFRGTTSATPDCPLAHGALDWLLELGRVTAHRPPDEHDVGAALRELTARFMALYRLTTAERAVLRRHVDALAEAGSSLPLVLQHGDPGTWNLLVGADGAPAFLDWEAAERHGMPLWDAFYFVRSFAVTVARRRGRTTRLAAVRRELLGDGPLSRLLAAATDRHCADIGLDRSLVEPLFATCWMHRALKEATRLSPRRLDSGHYVNLLRLCLSSPQLTSRRSSGTRSSSGNV
jgi:Phosphotransferase enzyme family